MFPLRFAATDCVKSLLQTPPGDAGFQESHDRTGLLTHISAITPTHFLSYMPAHPFLASAS